MNSRRQQRNLSAAQKRLAAKQVIRPAHYTAATVLSQESSYVPICSQTKQTCNNEFRSQGFPRITFEWNIRALSSSEWNSVTASILIKQWSAWYQTRHGYYREIEEDIQGVFERWLTTMWMLYLKQLKEGPQSTGPIISPPTAADRDLLRRKAERKKIAVLRSKAAKRIYPKDSGFVELFRPVACVSDYEDEDSPHPRRKRIIPRWRSAEYTQLVHQVDEAVRQITKPKSRITVARRLRRDSTIIEPLDFEEGSEAPKKLPIDCYAPAYLESLCRLQRRNLKAKDAIHLETYLAYIKSITTRPPRNSD
ncbi:hypothetical protein PtA15_6A665 [Puccinia triticina]|uniref:Uncharacterized protein n=1 Tax=Puccinia triticina TaxID=208348 RepID=A0ABY7CLS7_9BASI|nr:uncharacterized protein PtA15_6A665 [Puccinia triticina]WAQ86035.1 hypothetical protein PtA15_6A665 [Puccinia triticina]